MGDAEQCYWSNAMLAPGASRRARAIFCMPNVPQAASSRPTSRHQRRSFALRGLCSEQLAARGPGAPSARPGSRAEASFSLREAHSASAKTFLKLTSKSAHAGCAQEAGKAWEENDAHRDLKSASSAWA